MGARVHSAPPAPPILLRIAQKGSTALHEAARAGNLELAKVLLEHGANPNVTDTVRPAAAAASVRDCVPRGESDLAVVVVTRAV